MSHTTRITILAALCSLASVAHAGVLDGIGLMGDSATDEYQFYTADPDDRSYARNFVEILAAERGLNFGAFSLADQGSPRFQGYAYNWARTRSTAAANFTLGPGADFQPLTTLGQPTGLAGQVAAHQVTLTWMLIGNNDFLQYFVDPSIIPADPAALQTQLTNQVNAMATNALTAATTVLSADPNVKMVIATIPDEKYSPAAQASTQGWIAANIATAAQVQGLFGGITAATNAYNAALVNFATNPASPFFGRVAIADLNGLLNGIETAQPVGQPYMYNGIPIDLQTPGPGMDNFWLPDGIHPNTIPQGLIANLFLQTVNNSWGTNVPLLSASELTTFAASVPEPTSLALLLLPLAVATRRRPRS